MGRASLPAGAEVEALSDQRVDLAIKISLLLDKGVDPVTVLELRKQLVEIEDRIAARCKRFN